MLITCYQLFINVTVSGKIVNFDTMRNLSSITIARNERKNIAKCLSSIRKCMDEVIVIVDSSTEDNTAEIVRTFPEAKCVVREWDGYAETKEYALSLCTNDWVIWVDADEIITPELCHELLAFKESEPQHDAYSVPRKAFFLGKWIKHSGWYPGRVTRLFNKQKCKFSKNAVHEYLLVDGTTGELKSDLEHYTDPDIFHYLEKFNKYTSLAALELDRQKRDVGLSDLLLRPMAIFIKMYILKRGFLDGIQGFMLAVFSSAYVFTKYSKFWELKRKRENEDRYNRQYK